jgi:uncharacterized lipoprotein YmbA
MRYALLALCAACSLGGHRPTYSYFVLTSTPATASRPGGRAVAVAQVTIPGYLDREQIASRMGGNHLVYSTSDRWAEPLDQAFERTLRADLAARGIDVQSRADAELSIDVLRFERTGPDHVELWARWTLRGDGRVIDRGETRLHVALSGQDSGAIASALSEAIARMASQIAVRVRKPEPSVSAT